MKYIKPILKYLSELDIKDSFFDSLKNDYKGFEEWFKKKQKEKTQAYITESNGQISSFLLLKIEDEKEEYNDFLKSFKPAKRLKVSTFKVKDTGNKIGERFLKIIDEIAIKENVDEIYITIFDKYELLINMFLKNGFKKYSKKRTLKSNSQYELENVLVKKINKHTILMPIKPIYVDKIISGNKKFEYRKIRPKKDINKITIYSSYPVMKVVAEVEVLSILEDNKEKIWEETNKYSEITKDAYDEYYKNSKTAVAFKLGNVKVYDKPKILSDIKIDYVPQSFIYLD